LQALAQLLDSNNPSVRLRAAIHVLDRVLGKPVDRQEPSDSSGDLRYRLLSLVERVREQEAAKCEGKSLG
jgi:hypothetical protein